MKTLLLLTDLTFNDAHPHTEPLLVDDTGRVLRFTLKPGQRGAIPFGPKFSLGR